MLRHTLGEDRFCFLRFQIMNPTTQSRRTKYWTEVLDRSVVDLR